MRAELPVKLYYRIGEVAEVVGVEPHVLRYWESEFGTIRPQKSPKGQRVYSRRDLEKLLRVKELLYDEGYTIAGAKKRMREAQAEPSLAAAKTPPAAQGATPVLPLQTALSVAPAVASTGNAAPSDYLGADDRAEKFRAELIDLRSVLRAELALLDADRGP